MFIFFCIYRYGYNLLIWIIWRKFADIINLFSQINNNKKMSIEVEGMVVKCLPEITGEGKSGTWRKMEFVIQTVGEYPKFICLEVWGDKVDQAQALNLGENVKVAFSPESREYNERWYTTLRAYKIHGDGNKQAPKTSSENKPVPGNIGDEKDDLPF